MDNIFSIGDAFQDGIIIKINQEENQLLISSKEDFQQDFWLDKNGLNQPFHNHSIYGLGEDKNWRFPEIDELELMFDLKMHIGGFQNDFYWSSSLAEDNWNVSNNRSQS